MTFNPTRVQVITARPRTKNVSAKGTIRSSSHHKTYTCSVQQLLQKRRLFCTLYILATQAAFSLAKLKCYIIEVNFILEKDGEVYPIKFKCRSYLKSSTLTDVKTFRKAYPMEQIKLDAIVYAWDKAYWLYEQTIALPWNTITHIP